MRPPRRCARRVSLCSKLVRRIVVLSPVALEAAAGSLWWLVGVRLLRRFERSRGPSSRGGALAVVMVPTSPGWGPFFGARRAAAAVLAAGELVVPLSLRVDGVRCFLDEGRLIIQARAVLKKLPAHPVGQHLFLPGRGRGRLFCVVGNSCADVFKRFNTLLAPPRPRIGGATEWVLWPKPQCWVSSRSQVTEPSSGNSSPRDRSHAWQGSLDGSATRGFRTSSVFGPVFWPSRFATVREAQLDRQRIRAHHSTRERLPEKAPENAHPKEALQLFREKLNCVHVRRGGTVYVDDVKQCCAR